MGVFQLRQALAWQRKTSIDEIRPWFLRRSEAHEIVPELAPRDNEAVFDKIGMSAFEGTPLDTALRDCGIRSFLIAGVAIEIGMGPTVRHGADLGYIPLVVEDACGAGHEEAGKRALASLRYMGDAIVTSVAEVTSLLRGRRASTAEIGMTRGPLVFLLRCGAVLTGSAFLAVLPPVDWMASTHRWLGLGEYPRTPVVDYLARSVAAFYGFHGVLLFVISTDVVRFRPLVWYVAIMNVLFGPHAVRDRHPRGPSRVLDRLRRATCRGHRPGGRVPQPSVGPCCRRIRRGAGLQTRPPEVEDTAMSWHVRSRSIVPLLDEGTITEMPTMDSRSLARSKRTRSTTFERFSMPAWTSTRQSRASRSSIH